MASIKSVPNDILRLIIKEASPDLKCMQNNMMVCKRWNTIMNESIFWRDLYKRDFKKNGVLSDLVNYRLLYKMNIYNTIYENGRKYIQIEDLLVERLNITDINDTCISIKYNIAEINDCIDINLKLPFKGKITTSGSVVSGEFKNDLFKSSIKSIAEYVINNTLNKSQVRPVLNGKAFKFSLSRNYKPIFGLRIIMNCSECNKCHYVTTTLYDYKKYQQVCPNFNREIEYKNSIIDILLSGFLYNKADNTISIWYRVNNLLLIN